MYRARFFGCSFVCKVCLETEKGHSSVRCWQTDERQKTMLHTKWLAVRPPITNAM